MYKKIVKRFKATKLYLIISLFALSSSLLQNGKLILYCNKHAADKLKQADKLRAQQQLEQLQARYVGTGHADTTKFEWTSNIARDTYASYVGHPPLLQYMAIGMGEPKEKVRAMMIEVKTPRLYMLVDGQANEGGRK
jgi:splicing factor 3B subunit 5